MSLPPPEDELRALIESEKAATVDPGAAGIRIAERLRASLGGAPEQASGSWPHGFRRRLRAVGLGTFALGTLTGLALRSFYPRVEVRYVERIVEAAGPADAGPTPISVADSSPATIPSSLDQLPRVEKPNRMPATPIVADDALARERQMIEKARSALARGEPESALDGVSEHERAFPKGQLSETREAIAVQALARSGRRDAARARADRFRQTFPGSMYSPIVEAAISSIP